MITTPHDEHVLGGIRAQDEMLDAELPEPVPAPRWTWHHVAVLGAVALLLGVLVYNLAGGAS